MSVDKVIALGKEADIAMDMTYLNDSTTWWLLVLSILIIFVAVILSFTSGDSFSHFLGFIGILLLMWTGISAITNAEVVMDDEVTPWIKEVAFPYIETLPVEEKEIVFIKIDPELSSDTRGGLFYTYSKSVEKTPITVSFKDNGKVITKTSWVETEMELSETEKPYVEFQRLEQDLGHGIDAGIYNMKIHLPKNYTFTEIK